MMWIANADSLDEWASVPAMFSVPRTQGLPFSSYSQSQSQVSLLPLAGRPLLSSERLFLLSVIDRVYYRQIQLAPKRQCLLSFWGPADTWRAGHFNMGAVVCAISASAYLQGLTRGRAMPVGGLCGGGSWFVCCSVPLFQPVCRNY